MATQSRKKIDKRQKSPYSRFFKVLLVLSTIGTTLSLLGGLVSLPQIGSAFSIGPIYGLLTVVSYLTAASAAIGVWYLWQRRHIGFVLKLSAYGMTILTSIIMLYTDKPAIAATIDRVREQTLASGKVINEKLIESVVHLMFSVAYIGAILTSILFGILWWYAWKSQQAFESK